MSRIIHLLTNGSESCTNSYNRVQDYWTRNIIDLLQQEMDERREALNSFLSGYSVLLKNQIPKIIKDLELLAMELLGCRLKFGKEFLTINMVEIYADGIGDESGDLIKELNRLTLDESISDSNDIIRDLSSRGDFNYGFLNKLLPGPRLYDYYGRLDINILNKYLPFSLLIRQFKNDEGEFVYIKGETENILDAYKKRSSLNERIFSKFRSAVILPEYLSNG